MAGPLRLERRTTVLETDVLPIETMGPYIGKELLFDLCLLMNRVLLTCSTILLFFDFVVYRLALKRSVVLHTANLTLKSDYISFYFCHCISGSN